MRSWSRWVQDRLLPDVFNSRWPDGSQVTCSDEDKPVFRDLCHFLCICHASECQIWGPFQSISDFCNKGLCLTISPQARRQGLDSTPKLHSLLSFKYSVSLCTCRWFQPSNKVTTGHSAAHAQFPCLPQGLCLLILQCVWIPEKLRCHATSIALTLTNSSD